MKCRFEVVKNEKELKDAVEAGRGVIWDSKRKLHEILDNVEYLQDEAKLRLRACYEVKSKSGLVYKNRKVNNLSELKAELCNMTYDDEIIVKSNYMEEALYLTQQLINLEIRANVYIEADVYKRKVIHNIYNQHRELLSLAREVSNSFKRASFSKDLPKKFLEILESLSQNADRIFQSIEKVRDKIISVAVFSTKKSGKSMVVNALIREEYAPTSQELPTPNIIEYHPVPNIKRPRLIYKDITKEFDNATELKKFVESEFKKVMLTGESLPDMKVEYPMKEGINFLIYDTPGPDLAKSRHDIIDKIMPNVDVAVFIIDYTKYAQTSEMELLERLEKYFKSRGKKYSFICVVNKLDQMFLDASTEKILVRVGDFIYHKLLELGFREFLVIPVSAITKFYIERIKESFPQIVKADNIYDFISMNKAKLKEDKTMRTYMTFIQNVANSMADFYEMPSVKYDDVLDLCNFDTFEKYLIQVASTKASLERNWIEIENVVEGLSVIDNTIRGRALILQKEQEKIEKTLDTFLKEFEKKREEYKKNAENEFDIIEEEIYEALDYVVRTAIEQANEYLTHAIYKSVHKLSEAIDRDISGLKYRTISREEFERKWSSFSPSDLGLIEPEKLVEESAYVTSSIMKRVLEETIGSRLEDKKKKIDTIYKGLANDVIALIDKLNETLRKIVHNLPKDIKIEAPEVQLEFRIGSIEEIIMGIVDKVGDIQEIVIKRSSQFFADNIKGGFFRWLFSFFGAERYEVKEEFKESILSEYKEKLLNIKNEIMRYLLDGINQARKEKQKELKSLLKGEIKRMEEYIKTVEDTIRNIKDMLSLEVEHREKVLKVLNEIGTSQVYQEFVQKWKEVYRPYNEYMLKGGN